MEEEIIESRCRQVETDGGLTLYKDRGTSRVLAIAFDSPGGRLHEPLLTEEGVRTVVRELLDDEEGALAERLRGAVDAAIERSRPEPEDAG